MLYYSNAKINLGLNIIEKRLDGFHNLETVFYPINIQDALEFIPSQETKMSSSGINIDCSTNENLVIKAYRLLQKDFDLPTLSFHIHKTIPFGAGLGGGSANAAYTIAELNKFYKLKLPESKLLEYSNVLGSDCSFFIKNKALFASNKGQEFVNINLDLSQYYILLIHPGFSISTAEAFRNIKPHIPENLIIDIIKKPISSWKDYLINDFEVSLFPKYPILETIKNKLYSDGALYASMSGSGSSIFGIFKEKPSNLNYLEYWNWIGKL